MELYHLRTFVTVAEEQHLTRAAERLHTSQPAISAHIKALEEELGLSLFDRTPRGMQLTPAGAQLFERAQRALAAAGDFVHHARGMRDELVGNVRIGLNTDADFLRLGELQAALSERHPRLGIEFLAGNTGVNIPSMRVGKLDAAFVSGSCDDALFESHVLCDEILAVAVPERLRAQLDGCDVAALASQPWVYTSPDCPYHLAMRALFDAHGCKPERTFVADQEDAVRAMIRAGVGLGIMRRSEIERIAAEGEIHALPLELPPLNLRLAYLRKRANDPVIRAVRAAVFEVWALEPMVQREAV